MIKIMLKKTIHQKRQKTMDMNVPRRKISD